jgi:hypothetical protein
MSREHLRKLVKVVQRIHILVQVHVMGVGSVIVVKGDEFSERRNHRRGIATP